MSTRRQTLATDRFRRDRAAPFVRAATSFLIAHIIGSTADRVAKERFATDRDTNLLVKSAISPATTPSESLASTAVVDLIDLMGGASAAASLMGLGHQFTFDRATGLLVPGAVIDSTTASFVAEAAPIPAKDLSIGGLTLLLKKLAVLIPVTRETFEHSSPTIEAIVRLALMQALALALDAALLSNSAGNTIRPPGLLLGIAPLTPSTATDPQEAMVADIAALVSAVAPIAGNGEVVLVAATDQATALRLRQTREVFPVLASAALAAGTLIAVAPNGLASAIDPVPRFEIASEGTLVMDDAAGPLSTVGTPNSVAAPAISLFQSDTLALRVILQVAWGLRSPSAISYLTGAAW